jgi:predicted transcriptional regulator of viral defense system
VIDELVAQGRETFETRDVRALTGQSPQATSNLLGRMVGDGLVERVARGRYAIRPFGVLGTRAASEDVTLAVAAAFPRVEHRLAYGSALDFHGLLEHPYREIVVALASTTSLTEISGRPLRSVIETDTRLSIGAVRSDHGTLISSVERALLESAARPSLAGGISTVASALVAAEPDAHEIARLARALRLRAGLQRLGSLASALKVTAVATYLEPFAYALPPACLEPDRPVRHIRWKDPTWHVEWPYEIDELEAVVRQ